MSTERTAEEWGRVAVSLPGSPACWHRTEEHILVTTDGLHVADDGTWWTVDEHLISVMDVDHPATGGCLLAMLGRSVDVRYRGSRWSVEWRGMAPVAPGMGRVLATRDGAGSSLGSACIAAAEAIGRWPA